MRSLDQFLKNPFDDPHISLDNLFAFTTDHLKRMRTNNAAGDFTNRITATESSLGLLETKSTGARDSVKKLKNDYRKALPVGVAKIAGVIIAKYGENSAEVLECFPAGRGIFNSCRDDKVANHLQTLINGVRVHQADLGAQTLATVQAFLSGWMEVYGDSEGPTGLQGAPTEDKNLARENLQLMLFLNLLKIAEVFARQPEKLSLYMQQSLLQPHTFHPHVQSQPPTAPTSPAH